MQRHKTIYTTERALFHQTRALAAAPDALEITMLRQPDRDTLMPLLGETEIFISERAGVIDADMIAAAPHLKLILRLGSFTHDIDLDAAKSAGVIVCTSPDVGVIRVAEHVILQMLTLAKRINDVQRVALEARPDWRESQRTDEDTFAYNWSGRQGINQFWERTVGIIGFGEISAELARRLAGWGCTLVYDKRRRLPESVERALGLQYATRESLLAHSDYVVNLLPFFPETDMSLNADTFAMMKDGAYFVSCGSGSVIDEAALADAVRTGKLAGCALDTYEWEPIRAGHPLIAMAQAGANVLLTPHTAAGSSTGQIADKERRDDYRVVVRYLNGEPLPHRVV
jgi:phosphoglycerate dehydrogenase-like enzyme